MNQLNDDIFRQVFMSCLQKALSDLLPNAIREAVSSSMICKTQDFISIGRAIKRYNLCRKTFYNYHRKGYITLHSTEGKTFVSVMELENHIRKHPLPRDTV